MVIVQNYDNFLGISKETWDQTVNNYLKISNRYLSRHLQWYPLNTLKLSKSSDQFYEKVIKKGYFVFDYNFMKVYDNYLQKSDGSYRQAQLISPLLYLILEAICREIYHSVDSYFNSNHSLYAGNLDTNEITYQKQYDLFYKEVNILSDSYSHYIKTDFKDYFRYIDIDLLFSMIERETHNISSFHIYIYKLLFTYIGKGSFPILENSTGLSYLATKVYLNDLDKSLDDYLAKNDDITNYSIIRYVDDLYIFFNPKNSNNLNKIFLDFKNFYQSQSRQLNLTLNNSKTNWKQSIEIGEDLKNSFYGGEIYNEQTDIHEVKIETYVDFLDLLIERRPLTIKKYQDTIKQVFSFESIELSEYEVYNYILYKLSKKFIGNTPIIEKLKLIILEDIRSYDVKKISVAVLNTKDGELIRNFLNILFNIEEWHDSENYAAIIYLLNRNFKHEDLISTLLLNLEQKNNTLYQYIEDFCLDYSNLNPYLIEDRFNLSSNVIDISTTTSQLYFLYHYEISKGNYLSGHSYFKSFFDRITAEIQFYYGVEDSDAKKPNYKKYHQIGILERVYKEKSGSKEILQTAHKIRNSNPINHGSADLIKGQYDQEQILKSIDQLSGLLDSLLITKKL